MVTLRFFPHGAYLHISQTKTIQFAQRALSIPLPLIPGLALCPVAALEKHLELNNVPSSDPLFSVRVPGSASFQPITYSQFSRFLAKSIQAVGVDPSSFLPHSFRRGGGGGGGPTFAFDCGIPAELIKLQGDWRSDAYLVSWEMSDQQKRATVTVMAQTT